MTGVMVWLTLQAALKPVLIASGVYSDLCGDDSTCPEQDTKLNLLFVVATSTTNVGIHE